MKKIITISALLLFACMAKAQIDTIKTAVPDTTVLIEAEHEPDFPGGMQKFYQYLEKMVRYPANAFVNHIQGKVFVQMIIEKDGSLSHVWVIRGASPDLDKEAVRVMSTSPNWHPAMQNGKAVRFLYTVPVSFHIQNTTITIHAP